MRLQLRQAVLHLCCARTCCSNANSTAAGVFMGTESSTEGCAKSYALSREGLRGWANCAQADLHVSTQAEIQQAVRWRLIARM
jgi:hypothetical protein